MATVGCLWYLVDAWRAERLRITITQEQANDPFFDADGLFRLAKYRKRRDKDRHLPRIVITRRELWKQVLPGLPGMLLVFSLLLSELQRENIIKVDFLWLIWPTIVLMLVTLWVVYFAQRAVWLCVFRSASLAIFMGTFAVTLFLVPMSAMTFGWRIATALAAVAFLAACTVLFHVKRTVPYWTSTFRQNTMHKIDLHTGVFSVVHEWAPYPGEARISRMRIFNYAVGFGSVSGALLTQALKGTPWILEFLGIAGFLMLGIAGLAGSEAYHAYKLLELERQIGKPIVMDGYQALESAGPTRKGGRQA
jgi:hypothetical protein